MKIIGVEIFTESLVYQRNGHGQLTDELDAHPFWTEFCNKIAVHVHDQFLSFLMTGIAVPGLNDFHLNGIEGHSPGDAV